jgi:S1-C subfamily serine protease
VNISAVLVDRVTPGSQAAAMGVKAGDIIERVDEQAATTPAEAMDQLTLGSHADGDPVALLVSAKAGRR